MAGRSLSQASTPVGTEAATTYQLTLVTLAGEEIQLSSFENSID